MILQGWRKTKAKHIDTNSRCAVWEGLFCIFTAMRYLGLGQRDRWKDRIWTAKEFDKLSVMMAFFSPEIYTLCVCNSICLLAFGCFNELCENWQQSYLWFFLQSDVHPPVARQSSLLHSMMPEVIIISKNLNKHKGKGDGFTCSNRMAR